MLVVHFVQELGRRINPRTMESWQQFGIFSISIYVFLERQIPRRSRLRSYQRVSGLIGLLVLVVWKNKGWYLNIKEWQHFTLNKPQLDYQPNFLSILWVSGFFSIESDKFLSSYVIRPSNQVIHTTKRVVSKGVGVLWLTPSNTYNSKLVNCLILVRYSTLLEESRYCQFVAMNGCVMYQRKTGWVMSSELRSLNQFNLSSKKYLLKY